MPPEEMVFSALLCYHPHMLENLSLLSTAEHNFYDLTLAQIQSLIAGKGKEKFRAQQIFRWVYEKRVSSFAEMSNLSKDFREELEGVFHFALPKKISELKSLDGTRKYLFDIGQGMTIETVLIPSGENRLTLCVSSEVGCNMACKFCFTGKQKLKRRLSTSEIVGQFMHVHDSLQPEGKRISNIVFMGMGEPLDNPEAVFDSIHILTSEWGVNLSKKKITVSTSGLVPLMPLITQAGVRLAVSLNAPNEEIRDYVMPINKKYPLTELLAACKEHCSETGDKVTFEYVLLKGVTDSLDNAREVFQLTRGIPCKINIIPFNEHPGSDFQRPERESVLRFQAELIRLGAHVLLRKTMGRDIYAACGQLTSVYEGRPETFKLGQDDFKSRAGSSLRV